METIIKWNEGDGNIVATYNGSGNGTVSFSSDVNEGIDRSQKVQIFTDNKNVDITISQIGLREIYNEDFTLADGGTFNVLKNEF